MMLQRRLRERAMQDLETRGTTDSAPAVPAANDEGFAEEENGTVATSGDSENGGGVRKIVGDIHLHEFTLVDNQGRT